MLEENSSRRHVGEIDFALGAQSKPSADSKKFPELVLGPSRGKACQVEGRTRVKVLRLSVSGVEGECDRSQGS